MKKKPVRIALVEAGAKTIFGFGEMTHAGGNVSSRSKDAGSHLENSELIRRISLVGRTGLEPVTSCV